MKLIIFTIILITTFGLFALDLEEAKEIALENNSELLASEEAYKASSANLWQTYLTVVPTASISANTTYYDDTLTTQNNLDEYDAASSYRLVVNQPIFNGGKLWLGAGMAKDAHKISRE